MNRVDGSQDNELSPDRDKAVRLFTYLKDLCALRTTQVRDVATYDQVFWFRDLPRHKLCRCAVWHLTDALQPGPEQHSDMWMEVHKPTLKSPPELPDEVEPWIKDDDLADSSLSEPGFYEQIPLSAIQAEPGNIDPNALASLNDHPQIVDMLVNYIDDKWKPWANEDRELQKVQKTYNQLFNIYQRQEKLGEQYEVIVGIGLLLWNSPNSGKIKRHVLAIQGRIEFDRVRGILSVGSALNAPRPLLECSMLETMDRPNPTDLTEIENDAIALEDDPWHAVNLDRVLRGSANALLTNGDYNPSFEHAGGASAKPVINLAPALILRKRTRRTFEDLYRQIVDQIRDGEEIPENIRRIIDIVDESPDERAEGGEIGACPATPTQSDNELYFPLPANDDQKRIVRKLEHHRGVLVQGPPGTGKSHTICNLIAHFLAKGKRILVTSETPRALEVLRQKLNNDVPEIEELCVVWLGSDPDSQKALEKSVRGITQRKANWTGSREQNMIDESVRRLDAERRDQARLSHDLRACRESDVYQHSRVFGRYSGTLQQIALQINKERDQYQWFADRPRDGIDPSATSDVLLKMARIRRKLTPELAEQLRYRLFPIEQLVQPNEFFRLINAEKKANIAHKDAQEEASFPGYRQLSALDRTRRGKAKAIVEKILATQDNLSKHFHSWVERASREISGDQVSTWRHILASTVDRIDHIEHLLNEHGTLDVTGLGDKDLRLAEEHATALKRHLEGGKGLGFWRFRTRVVKDGLYLLRSVLVNGKTCDNPHALSQLAAWIEISTRIQSLADLWKGITPPPTGNALLQCSAYRDMCTAIEHALSLHDHIEEARRTCLDCGGIRFPAWHSQEEVIAFYKALEALDLEEDFLTAQRLFSPLADSIADFINSGHYHPSTEQLQLAVKRRDTTLYRHTFEALSSIHTYAKANNFTRKIHELFRACAPRTCENYDSSFSEPAWDERFAAFEAAWAWGKTDRWLDELSDKERPKEIQRALENSVLREREALKNLAASKAWQHCMANLREKERMALVAWKQAVDSIRGGTGKYAETRRETARRKFDECRAAIPAWVMPLYQVVQAIRPKKHQFDVVIIDEASQSGPEALFLNYISDRIVVVGDDKQITPMHVGVDREQVLFLRRKHLRDIPHEEALDLDGSLFSQAELRFPDRIRLREHFRCMPEIIQFSNNLSYTAEPLIPLWQYGIDRLEPVRTVFVKDGYRKGASDDIENPAEAAAVAAKIAECCEDPAYAGKTFGVICLMGNRQAELVNGLLLKEIGAEEMEKRRLVCGRPYDFQGDERDVVFLSMVEAAEPGQVCRMVRDADTQRRFNVAASRARDQLWLFHSITLNDLRPECLRYRLIDYCLNPKVHQPEEIGETTVTELRRIALDKSLRERKPRDVDASLPFESWFEVDVFLKIVDRGYRVLPQFEVNTRRIDLVVEGLRGRLAVECNGDQWHGPDRYESDMARQRDLERCGWVFWTVRGSDFYRNTDAALDELWDILEQMKITPRHSWDSDRERTEAETTIEERIQVADTAVEYREKLDEHTAEDEEEREDEPAPRQDTEGRLDRALAYARSRRWPPEEMPPLDIQAAILHSLEKCPNHSCTLKSLTSRVLKELGVLTRSNPRLAFEKRVMRNLGALRRKGLVEEYKAKNRRIRLMEASQDTLLFH